MPSAGRFRAWRWQDSWSGLSRSTMVIGSGLMLGRLLGFIRELLLARAFGVSAQMDALVAALNFGDVVASILFGGAAAAVIIPPLAQRSNLPTADFWRLPANLANISALGLLLIGGLLMAGARIVAEAVAPGLPHPSFELAVSLLRITAASLPLAGVAFVLMPALQARSLFAIPSLTTAIQNLTLIVFIIALVPVFGPKAVAWGALSGACLRLFALWLKARQEGFHWYLRIDFRDPDTLKVFRLIGPAILGFSIFDLNLLIDRNFASQLAVGSIASLNYADKLTQVPLAVLASAVSLAILPALANHVKLEDWRCVRKELGAALGLVLICTLPLSACLVVFRVEIVRALLGHGAFNSFAIAMTSPALLWYSLALPANSVNLVLVRVFHSRLDFKTPLVLAVLVVASHVFLNWILAARVGHVGIAISNFLTAMLNTGVLAVALRLKTRLWT